MYVFPSSQSLMVTYKIKQSELLTVLRVFYMKIDPISTVAEEEEETSSLRSAREGQIRYLSGKLPKAKCKL